MLGLIWYVNAYEDWRETHMIYKTISDSMEYDSKYGVTILTRNKVIAKKAQLVM